VSTLETGVGFGIPAGKHRLGGSTALPWDAVGGTTLFEGGIAAVEQPTVRRIASNVIVMRIGVPITSGRQSSPSSEIRTFERHLPEGLEIDIAQERYTSACTPGTGFKGE
jgi:hypothetical protein